MNIRQDSATCNGNASQELVELLVILDSKSNVTGSDTALFVVTCGIASQLENLGTEVLEDGGKVHGGTSTHAGGVLALAKVTADTTNGELQTGLGRRGRALFLATASFSFSCLLREMTASM
jgi:hypothetical protein